MRKVFYLMLCVTLVAGLAHSQGATTGSLSGTVTDPNGDPMPGVTISATLVTTGTRYATVTDAVGTFRISNVKVGSPYEVVASLAGFKTQNINNVAVRLGDNTSLEIQLQLEAATGEIVVVSESSPLISPTKMGVGSSVSGTTIMAMPSVNRSIYDSARTNPVFSTPSADEDTTVLSVAGRNPRYNNISIDGAVNNDVFGLADSGTPGGQSATQPIQLDAVQELQLVTSTFDVRQGGFTGGSINIITRSGTNKFHGNVFGYTSERQLQWARTGLFPRVRNLRGHRVRLQPRRTDRQGQDLLLLQLRPQRPRTADRLVARRHHRRAVAERLLRSGGRGLPGLHPGEYGYDPGGLGEVNKLTPSDKVFLRFDFNFSEGSTLTARYNYVDAQNVINRPSNGTYEWPNEAYDFSNKTNSMVAQWNAVFGDNKFNELRLTYQTIRDKRHGVGQDFPHVVIYDVDGDRNRWEIGTEQYSTFNSLDTDIFELTDDFTFYKGNHEIVVGTHNEFYSFSNLFLSNGFGSYTFDTLDDYYSGIANGYSLTYSNYPESPADEFSNYQLGFYAGDTWRAKSNLTLVYGLRVDIPIFPDKPEYNPEADAVFGIDTSEVPSGNALWSPRIGFNWDISGDGVQTAARRRRPLLGPHALRVDFQQLRPYRHPHRGPLLLRRPPVQPRSLQPAHRRRRRLEPGAQHGRSRLRVPADLAHQPRLRPTPSVAQHGRHRRGNVRHVAERDRLQEPQHPTDR